MSIKAFCNETRMEEAIAAAPICHEDDGLCPVSWQWWLVESLGVAGEYNN